MVAGSMPTPSQPETRIQPGFYRLLQNPEHPVPLQTLQRPETKENLP